MGLQGAALLKGYRGRAEADVEAVVDTVMAIATLAMTHWNNIEELDVNPLMVRPKGNGAIAVDALITLTRNNTTQDGAVGAKA